MTGSYSERREIILEVLMDEGEVEVSRLSEQLKVTPVTARADLVALEKEGLLVRVHGGGVPAFHQSIMERMERNRPAKIALAKRAADMIEDGDTAMISAGTTTALIARYLLKRRDIHIVTNNTLLLRYARANPHIRVTLVGGEFHPSEEGIVGPLALEVIEQFHVSKAFIGTDGASLRQGFTAHFVESADLVRKMAEQASQVIVLADAIKFGKPGFARILPFDAVDTLVTGSNLNPSFEAELAEAGVDIVKV